MTWHTLSPSMPTGVTITTADLIERLAFANPGAEIEYHGGFMWLTLRGVTLRAVLSDAAVA